jgi:hypothetical protein
VGEGGEGVEAEAAQALLMPDEDCLTVAARAGLPLSICTANRRAVAVQPNATLGYGVTGVGGSGPAAAPPAPATGPGGIMALKSEFNPARFRNMTDCLNAASAQHVALSLCRRR